ncbi:hypothetical protein BDP27DRAFT_1316925 [Rhodocollybia butyracea]|uniref:Uncharacterized protein n=1 Tax=Rhodocollybia butyracea TaxID=206335 RepID=A0A9P5Q2L2_9AGAR|nr:hypothetical protein BDP27DRAFT_1316925 [Rhodocollybia butyracea]
MMLVIVLLQPLFPHLLVLDEPAQHLVAEALQHDMLLLYHYPESPVEAFQRSTNWVSRGRKLMVVPILFTLPESFLRSLGLQPNMLR